MTDDPKLKAEIEALVKKHAKWSYSTGKYDSMNQINFYTLENLDKLSKAIDSYTKTKVKEAVDYVIGEDDKPDIDDSTLDGEYCETCLVTVDGVDGRNPCKCDVKNELRAEQRKRATQLTEQEDK